MGAITNVGISMSVLLVLTGCGNKTPSCTDPAAVDLVKTIYQQSFDKELSAMSVNGGQFPRKYGVGKQSDAVIRDSQLTALNFL